ncbi:MAG TPA: hypothetical protein VJ827_12340, partial [Rubrobacter sp.]|nr:hypothetical protein [Rubrobacter sp.]
MNVLTINCGSSTLKFELFEVVAGERASERSLARGIVDRIGGRAKVEFSSEGGERTVLPISANDHGEATKRAIRLVGSSGLLGGVGGVGHRVVHGGAHFLGPALLDAGAEEAIGELAGLAPLHNG